LTDEYLKHRKLKSGTHVGVKICLLSDDKKESIIDLVLNHDGQEKLLKNGKVIPLREKLIAASNSGNYTMLDHWPDFLDNEFAEKCCVTCGEYEACADQMRCCFRCENFNEGLCESGCYMDTSP